MLFDVDGQAAVEVGDLDPLADGVRVDDVGDVAVDGVEGERVHQRYDCDVPPDESVGLLEQIPLDAPSLRFGVEVVVDGLVDLHDERVVVQIVPQEGVGGEDFVGGLEVFEEPDEGFPTLLLEEVVNDARRPSRSIREINGCERRLGRRQQVGEAPLQFP